MSDHSMRFPWPNMSLDLCKKEKIKHYYQLIA